MLSLVEHKKGFLISGQMTVEKIILILDDLLLFARCL